MRQEKWLDNGLYNIIMIYDFTEKKSCKSLCLYLHWINSIKSVKKCLIQDNMSMI